MVAIDGGSFLIMNAALYILSRGPWIPNHISLHVRQAALAAVGAGCTPRVEISSRAIRNAAGQIKIQSSISNLGSAET